MVESSRGGKFSHLNCMKFWLHSFHLIENKLPFKTSGGGAGTRMQDKDKTKIGSLKSIAPPNPNRLTQLNIVFFN